MFHNILGNMYPVMGQKLAIVFGEKIENLLQIGLSCYTTISILWFDYILGRCVVSYMFLSARYFIRSIAESLQSFIPLYGSSMLVF